MVKELKTTNRLHTDILDSIRSNLPKDYCLQNSDSEYPRYYEISRDGYVLAGFGLDKNFGNKSGFSDQTTESHLIITCYMKSEDDLLRKICARIEEDCDIEVELRLS